DILYSDIVTKTQADAGQAVTIPMSHLFAAAGIMVKNYTLFFLIRQILALFNYNEHNTRLFTLFIYFLLYFDRYSVI
ncbi:MAG: hypothetical protein IKH90_08935, partial [Ruminococcus sp.]|nr:hypothetical protein [Ruminococcus sp.]